MIERLYVQNFRCFESFSLDFASTPSALIIGKNGAGKSTIRHALSIFQSICRGSSRTGTLIAPNDFSFQRADRPMRFEIEVELTGKRFKYAVGLDWPDALGEARILDEGLTFDGEQIFARNQAKIQLLDGSSFGLDLRVFALPVINQPSLGRAVQDLKAFLASIVLVAPIPTAMSGFSEQPSLELQHDASNFASCFRALLQRKPAAYSAFDAYIKEAIPDFSSVDHEDRGKDGQQMMVNFKSQDSGQTLRVEFDALSDGEKCFFLSGYVIASTAAGFPVVCVWDEPDNHLSLSQVGQFITSLRRTAKQGGQFIATSHHPETVRKFSADNTFVLTRKSHLDPSLPKFLKDFTYSGDLINALMRDEIIG